MQINLIWKNIMTDEKQVLIRMPKDIWMFLKKTSADQETSMREIILNSVITYKNKIDKKGK